MIREKPKTAGFDKGLYCSWYEKLVLSVQAVTRGHGGRGATGATGAGLPRLRCGLTPLKNPLCVHAFVVVALDELVAFNDSGGGQLFAVVLPDEHPLQHLSLHAP